MSLPGEIEKLRSQFLSELEKVQNSKDLEQLKTRYLGKKGSVASLMELLKNSPNEEKPRLGKCINDIKEELSSYCEKYSQTILLREQEEKIKEEKIDISLPGRKSFSGRLHPITQTMDKMLEIMISMGFSVQNGPILETDYYNFEALNFPPNHPARDMQDTFYITPNLLLRTHTTNVQSRVIEKHTPPIRVAVAGKVFRNEDVSARSHVFFHQIDGFYIDKSVAFPDLFSTLDEFWYRFFGKKVETRYRPSYFPFVEPGLEADIRCTICSGKGCRICKYSGWLEVIGAGMIHPEVLRSGGIDPDVYSGYAWGMGLERLTLLQYDLKDLRVFWENDLRLLEQFNR
jgi:phenylalanyl-tRNA synthetase alpha chain